MYHSDYCYNHSDCCYDRVNQYVLFDKLLKRGVPLYVVRILIFWYTSQTMYVRWNNVISSGFGVSNGVRQGGILSPYLFCVYMDDLSIKLNDIKVGCRIGTPLINHLMYADDLVLLSPSAMGLSLLLSVCSAYGIEHDIKYNSAKSNVMIFRCNKMKDIRIPNFELNNVQSRPSTTRLVIRRIGCNAVDRASRFFCRQGEYVEIMLNNVTVILVVRDACKINTTSTSTYGTRTE